MSKVEIDGVKYECPPEVAGLLQAVSEERDELQGIMARAIPKTFGRELTELLNKHSIENVVDMPDFLLAGMICRMIEAMGPSIKKTLDWHDCDAEQDAASSCPENSIVALKVRVSEILHEALRGYNLSMRYRNGEGYVRWGLVERDIYAAIDKAYSVISRSSDHGNERGMEYGQENPGFVATEKLDAIAALYKAVYNATESFCEGGDMVGQTLYLIGAIVKDGTIELTRNDPYREFLRGLFPADSGIWNHVEDTD